MHHFKHCCFEQTLSERSFSELQRMKLYLKSKMGQDRLRSVSVLNIERQYSINCISKNIEKVIDLFGSRSTLLPHLINMQSQSRSDCCYQILLIMQRHSREATVMPRLRGVAASSTYLYLD